MFSQLFGKYLVEKQIITDEDYLGALQKQLSVRVKLGTIAIADGLLTEEQVEEINQLQMQFDKRFGDIAVEKGLLTDAQISELLKKQGNPYMQFIEALTEVTRLTATVLEKTLKAFQTESGFSDSEIAALKNDDIDALVPIFAPCNKPYVTDIVGLVVRNINRFISRDFYIGRIRHLNSLPYVSLAGQKLSGESVVKIALAEETENGAFVLTASAFSNTDFIAEDTDVFDAVSEFINVNSGLFASELSKKEIELELEPTFAYRDQAAMGDFYALPIYVENRKLTLLLSVDSEVRLGQTPYKFGSTEKILYSADHNSKGNILIVDDSKMSRKILKEILEYAGYSVLAEAGDGIQALEAYRHHKADLVTLDITMPNMDGIEALMELKKYDPDVKVIMITAAGQESKLIKALKYGAKKFITKPFDRDEVIRNIEEVL